MGTAEISFWEIDQIKILAVGVAMRKVAEISGVGGIYADDVRRKLDIGMEKVWYKKNYTGAACASVEWRERWNIW